jgi:MFS family permease
VSGIWTKKWQRGYLLGKSAVRWTGLFRDRTAPWLFLSVFAFHLANAPILPTVALYVKQLGGSDNLMTATVLTAQVVMVSLALATGWLCDAWGLKPVLAIAFLVLPLRILSYTFVTRPPAVGWLQGLDGAGGRLFTGLPSLPWRPISRAAKDVSTLLMGLFAAALAIGGVAEPLLSGALVQHLGFKVTFDPFAGLAAVGAAILRCTVPETRATRN